MTEREIRRKLAALGEEVVGLKTQLDKAMRRKRIECSACGARSVVSSLTYIQTHWYVEPYSCTGGDYWNEGEGQFDCPRCGHRNRLYDRPEVVGLKRFFATVEKTHDKR
jgi:DNA-directed RNA polymerase subunit RPC12/RpoP